jgi:hypothetical protein
MMSGASPSGAIGVGFTVVRRVRGVVGFLAVEPEDEVDADRVDAALRPVVRLAGVASDGPAAESSAAAAVASGASPAPASPAPAPAAPLAVPAGFRALDREAAVRPAPVAADARGVRRGFSGVAGVASADSPCVGRSSSDGGSAVLIRLLPKA